MYHVTPSALQGTIRIPPSKSQSLRAILFGSLAEGKSIIHHYLPSPDTLAMAQACRSLGSAIEIHENHMEIIGIAGRIKGADDVIHAGNSGIVLRFMAGIAALGSEPILLTGDASIRSQRSMAPLLEALTQLGVSARSTRGNGYAPLIIEGPLKSGYAEVYGADSQHVSPLLIAASLAPRSIEIQVKDPGEKPWVDLTLDWLQRLGVRYEREGYTHFWFNGHEHFPGFSYHVPGDLSSLAFPVVAALITDSELSIEGVDLMDNQGDKQVIEALIQMGGKIEIYPNTRTLKVCQGSHLRGIDVDINAFVDGLPILAVAACYAQGKTVLRNAAVVRQKECDRLACVAQELKKMGAAINETADSLEIQQSDLIGAPVFSHHDHRLAMSLAVAGLGARGETLIEATACISKTFPNFQVSFQKLGAKIL